MGNEKKEKKPKYGVSSSYNYDGYDYTFRTNGKGNVVGANFRPSKTIETKAKNTFVKDHSVHFNAYVETEIQELKHFTKKLAKN